MKKIIGVIFLLWLILFLLLLLLEQPLSVTLASTTLGGMTILLWAVIPLLVVLLSFSMFFFENRKFRLLVSISMGLLLMSNITFAIFLNIAQYDFGIAFIILFVWGSTCLFVVALLFKLLYAYFFKKNFKDVLGSIFNIRLLISLLVSAMLTFLLWQSFLMVNAIEAYKAVKILKPKGCQDYALAYFYRPYAGEIRLCNEMRWSYGRLKFVENGR